MRKRVANALHGLACVLLFTGALVVAANGPWIWAAVCWPVGIAVAVYAFQLAPERDGRGGGDS